MARSDNPLYRKIIPGYTLEHGDVMGGDKKMGRLRSGRMSASQIHKMFKNMSPNEYAMYQYEFPEIYGNRSQAEVVEGLRKSADAQAERSPLRRFGSLLGRYGSATVPSLLYMDDVAAASAGSPYDRATGPEMYDMPHTTTPMYGDGAYREKLKKEYPELSSIFGGTVAPVASSEFSVGDAVRWVGDKLGLVDEDLKARFKSDSADPDLALGRSLSTEAARKEFEESLAAWAERPLDPVEDMYSGPPEIDEATGAVLTYSMEEGRPVGDMSTAAGRAYEEKHASDEEAWDEESKRILERDLAWYASREYKDIEADRLADRKLMETAAEEAEKARLESGARWTEEAPWTFAEGLESLPPWASTRDLYTVPDVKVWGAGRSMDDMLEGSFAGHSWVAPSGRVMRDKLTPAESAAASLSMEDYLPKDEAIYFPESLTSSVTGEAAGDLYKRLRESEVPHRERTERIAPRYLPEWEDPSGTLYAEAALPSTHPDVGLYAGWLPSTRERFDVDAGITYEDVVRDRASLGYTHPEAMSRGMFSDADVGWLTPYRGEMITPESFAALIPTPDMGEFE